MFKKSVFVDKRNLLSGGVDGTKDNLDFTTSIQPSCKGFIYFKQFYFRGALSTNGLNQCLNFGNEKAHVEHVSEFPIFVNRHIGAY